MTRTLFAADIGTSSLKAAIIDSQGRILASGRYRFPRGKRIAEDWHNAFLAAWDELASSLSASATIDAIVISGHGPTLVSFDSKGSATSTLLWNDPIPTQPRLPNGDAWEGSRSIFLPRLTALRSMHPHIWEKADLILGSPESLIRFLTGESVTILPEPRYAEAYWTDSSLAAAHIDAAKLPRFVLPGETVGLFRGKYPVLAGGPDFFVALIGTGAIVPCVACDRAGTSEGLNVCTREPVRHPKIRTLPSALPGLWNASYLIPDSGARFHAWRRETGQSGKAYPELMEEIAKSPIGSPHPGRALVEEIGFSVREGITVLAQTAGCTGEFRMSGGQARNDIWVQMKADISGAVFSLTETSDGELTGNAIIAATALGEYTSLSEAAQQMVRVTKRYEPNVELHRVYTEKYLAWQDRR